MLRGQPQLSKVGLMPNGAAEIFAAAQGGAVGEVVASEDRCFELGDLDLSMFGWREIDKDGAAKIAALGGRFGNPDATKR
jgi:NADPH-dependent curcumin reductase CurA